MRRNVVVLFVVCAGYGLSKGLVDFAAPLYLRARNWSFRDIGTIFSLSALVIFFLRIYLARLSDLVGRKLFYAASLGVTSLSNLCFPFAHRLMLLAGLRAGTDLSFGVRETMHATALYESRRSGYLSLQGKTRSVEYACIGLGTITAACLIARTSEAGALPFVVSCLVLLATALVLAVWFREPRELATRERAQSSLVRLLTTSFPREIRILAAGGFVFGIAVSASHYYLPPLFFKEKFPQLSTAAIGQIQLVHVLSHVPGLFLVGWFVRRRLKSVFFWALFIEGGFLALAGCFGTLGPTLFFWWTHDVIGASLWVPVQWALIQRYAREDSRGLDASVVPAVTALGAVFGPLLAGHLAELKALPLTGTALTPAQAISLPMIASGILMSLAALPLLLLPPDPKAATHAPDAHP